MRAADSVDDHSEHAIEVRADAVPQSRCRRWWWRTPRSRCLGVRRRHDGRLGSRWAIGLGAAAVVAGLVLARSTGFGGAMGNERFVWLLLAVLLEAGSMIAFARLQQRVLATAGLRLRISSALAIVFAGNAVAVTVPVAGTTASAAFTHRQYLRRGASGAVAGWAMAISGVISTATFAALVGLGGLANGSSLAVAAGIASIATAILPVVGLAAVVRSGRARRWTERGATRLLSVVRRVTSRPRRDPESLVSEAVNQLAGYRLPWRTSTAAVGWAALNWVLDACCLWTVLQAFDASVPLRDLALVYSAATAAASLTLTPAGIGTVEAAIAVALTSLGASGAHALPASIAYRAVSTWLILLVGWLVLTAMRRRSAHDDLMQAASSPVSEVPDDRALEAA